jgi:hypothetical protein
MSFEINCKLIESLPVQTGEGARGPWTKQTFIAETIETYPKKIAFLAFNEPVQQLKTIHPGTTMKVNFRVESREYNGRWYTDIRAVSISPLMASAPSEAAPSNNGYAAPAPMTADPMAGSMGGGNDVDDLPF